MIKSPIKSIREKCLDCVCGSVLEVKLCPCDGKQSTFCALHPYRFGRRPAGGKKRIMSEAQKQTLKKMLEANKPKVNLSV